jgi:hypothetical protein
MSSAIDILANIFMRKSCAEEVLYSMIEDYSQNTTLLITGSTEPKIQYYLALCLQQE